MLYKRLNRAQLTTLSLNYPHMTKDRAELCLAKLVKDLVKGYKGNRNQTYRNQRFFLEIFLTKGLYCGHKGKRYATEAVTTAKKLPLGDLKGIKDNLGKVQNQQDNDKETKSRRQSQKGS